MSPTIVAFHAHPDDEALLTAGTMARAAAEGHRVVLVLATDGGAGLAADELRDDGGLGERRLEEARRSSAALGVARVEWLGYADSGSGRRARAGRPGGHPVLPGPPSRRPPSGSPPCCAPSGPTCCSPTTPTAATGTATTCACTRSPRAPPRSPAPPGARGHRAARHHRAGGARDRPRLPLPRRVRPDVVRARLLGPLRDHPPGERAPVRRCQAGGDAGARVAGDRRRRGIRRRRGPDRRPHPGGLPAHPPTRLRSRVREGVVPRPRPPAGRTPCAPTSSRGNDELAHQADPADRHRAGAGRGDAHLGPALLRQDVVGRHLERHPHHPAQPRPALPGADAARAVVLHLHLHRLAARAEPRQGAHREPVRVLGVEPAARRWCGRPRRDVRHLPVVGLLAPGHVDVGHRHRRLERDGPHRPAGRRHRRAVVRRGHPSRRRSPTSRWPGCSPGSPSSAPSSRSWSASGPPRPSVARSTGRSGR